MARISVCFLFFIFLLLGTSVHAGNITYTDKLGRTVKVSVPVQRAVLFSTYELIPVMGVWDRVVGVGRWAYDDELMKALKPDIASKIASPGSGTDINVELLMKLNPDIVITFRVGIEVIEYLGKKNIKVIAIYPESLNELYSVMSLHGYLFKKEKEIEKSIKEMQDIFKLIEKRVSKISKNNRKRVLWLHHRPNSVAGGKGIINEILFYIGGINPASIIFPKENIGDTSFEKMIEMDPELIFIWGNAPFDAKKIMDNYQLKNVKAVKNGNVYKVPEWSTWSPRFALIALYMAMKLYPEQFKDVNFEKVADDFYKKVFGISYYKVRQNENY